MKIPVRFKASAYTLMSFPGHPSLLDSNSSSMEMVAHFTGKKLRLRGESLTSAIC
jgi:hypothetical protein